MSELTTQQWLWTKEAIRKARHFLISSTERGTETVGVSSSFLGYKIPSNNGTEDEGIWAEWTWDDKKFELINDRYGFFPLYYFASEGKFALSSSSIDLLSCTKVSPKLNDPAIAVFLRLGFFIGNDTPFQDIKTVPPGSHIVWQDGKLEVNGKDPIWRSAQNDISRQAAIQTYGEIFQSAVEQMLPNEEDKVGLPLSGGRDSRHILLALKRAGYSPDACMTVLFYPPRSNEDVKIARQVAAALEILHVSVPQYSSRLDGEIRKNILTNFCADEHAWMIALADYIHQEKYTLLYDGIGGDVLSAGLFLTEDRLTLYESGDFHSLAQHLLKNEGYLPKMLPKHLYQRWNRELAVQHLAKELAKYANAPNPIGQFFFWNRTRREIALSPWSILASDRLRVLAPFLAHQVYDFLSGLPASWFLDHQFHTAAITGYYPEYAELPFQNKYASKKTSEWQKKLTDLQRNFNHFAQFSQEFFNYIFAEKG